MQKLRTSRRNNTENWPASNLLEFLFMAILRPFTKTNFSIYMKSFYSFLLSLIFCAASFAQKEYNPFELMVLEGSWTGVYTYLDRMSEKPVTIEVDAKVKIDFAKNEIFLTKYFVDDKNLELDTIPFTDHTFDGWNVVDMKKESDGSIILITEAVVNHLSNKDKLRLTYTIHKDLLSIREDRMKDSRGDWEICNEYLFDRKY